MNSEYNIPLNLKCTREYMVGKEHTAHHIGSGDLEVLSTPSMIAFIEHTCLECVQKYLDEKHTTVGVYVGVKHLKPAPIGEKVRVEVEVVEVEGRRIKFNAKVFWKDMLIGEGLHERYIVDKEKFINKLKKLVGATEK